MFSSSTGSIYEYMVVDSHGKSHWIFGSNTLSIFVLKQEYRVVVDFYFLALVFSVIYFGKEFVES